MEKGDIFMFKNGTIGRVTAVYNSNQVVKLRMVRGVVGKYGNKERKGQPYTYQYHAKISNVVKKSRRMGTEELLGLLFWCFDFPKKK